MRVGRGCSTGRANIGDAVRTNLESTTGVEEPKIDIGQSRIELVAVGDDVRCDIRHADTCIDRRHHVPTIGGRRVGVLDKDWSANRKACRVGHADHNRASRAITRESSDNSRLLRDEVTTLTILLKTYRLPLGRLLTVLKVSIDQSLRLTDPNLSYGVNLRINGSYTNQVWHGRLLSVNLAVRLRFAGRTITATASIERMNESSIGRLRSLLRLRSQHRANLLGDFHLHFFSPSSDTEETLPPQRTHTSPCAPTEAPALPTPRERKSSAVKAWSTNGPSKQSTPDEATSVRPCKSPPLLGLT